MAKKVLCLALLLIAIPASAGEDVKKTIRNLNSLTGVDPVKGAVKELLEKKSDAVKLVTESATLLKDKKVHLTYDAAHALAMTAAELKDLPAAEALYRVCMDYAAKLQSPQKLLESYGGLIDVLYEAKKYPESAAVCRELLELKTDDGKPRIVVRAYTNRFGEYDF